MKRRNFIQTAGLAAASALVAPQLLGATRRSETIKSFGFQAFTVRDVIYKDMPGTLKRLRKAGYDYMELFDFSDGKILGKPIAEAKAIFEKSKLQVKSIHTPTGAGERKIPGTLWHEPQRAIDDAATLGAEFIVCPWLMPFERESIDQYKALCEQLNKVGEAAKKSNIQLCYHNHDFEFMELDGEVPMEVILKETDPQYVKIELDIYWARKAEKNPLTFFRQNMGRVPLWHVKDLSLDDGQPMTEIGNGIIDWRQIFGHKNDAGMEYFFVEQDGNFAEDSVSSLETSIKHLKKLVF
ncbi:sugar phosphate isomerase/epimerase [Roseivirga sp. UBA1976]|uniref:sugar phosphate isomerase/epimerase family protein n=1 Tax=Roseivirga sp. UBA1976 TaxID=1947386 RepID=UPI00257A87E7|nr:sugar phosphate isomerase/epimerase [Roseivirga sp. UBA1976]MEC7755440.1 sugar phosphate isomerase/epimerase [Bacteroidota bacterium]|tara:strand:+ start:3789 stop:4676 length:888 start_codon:yes stop_codon:yes gene_type:complete